MGKNIDLSIISVTYNSHNEVTSMIESVINTVRKHTFEIIISDNSPNGETKNVISDFQRVHKNIIYIKNSGNLGFSKANNIAIKKSNGKLLLFLNPDVQVCENTIDGVYNFIENDKKVGAATCAVYLPNGNLDDSCHRGFPTPWNSFTYFLGLSKLLPGWKLFSGYSLTYLDFKKTHEIDSLAGSFMMIPFEVGQKLGWWDEDFFFYGEDLDFCFRIKEAGYKIFFLPEFSAIHHKGMSSGIKKVSQEKSKATRQTKIWATKKRFDAMEIFYRKHYMNKYPKLIQKLVFLGISLKRKKTLDLL